MSRLDSFIRRLNAQRDILDAVARDLGIPSEGPIFEIGLGSGRTYSHLRALFPGRRIIAFDRTLNAHRSCVPDSQDLILGEIRETAQAFRGQGAAFVHADIATAFAEVDAETLTWLPQLAGDLLGQGGLCASGLPLEHPRLAPLPIPGGIAPGRYYLYARR